MIRKPRKIFGPRRIGASLGPFFKEGQRDQQPISEGKADKHSRDTGTYEDV